MTDAANTPSPAPLQAESAAPSELSGLNPDVFFAHVANLGDRFLAADFTRRVTFLDQCKFVLIGLATLVVVWRMPRFIRDLDRELSGEKL